MVSDRQLKLWYSIYSATLKAVIYLTQVGLKVLFSANIVCFGTLGWRLGADGVSVHSTKPFTSHPYEIQQFPPHTLARSRQRNTDIQIKARIVGFTRQNWVRPSVCCGSSFVMNTLLDIGPGIRMLISRLYSKQVVPIRFSFTVAIKLCRWNIGFF